MFAYEALYDLIVPKTPRRRPPVPTVNFGDPDSVFVEHSDADDEAVYRLVQSLDSLGPTARDANTEGSNLQSEQTLRIVQSLDGLLSQAEDSNATGSDAEDEATF